MQWPGYLHHQFKSSKSLPVPLRSLYIGFYLQERDSLWVYLAFESHELAVKCKSLSKVSGAERKSTYLDLWSLLLPGSLFLLIFKKEVGGWGWRETLGMKLSILCCVQGGMKRDPWNEVEHSVRCAKGIPCFIQMSFWWTIWGGAWIKALTSDKVLDSPCKLPCILLPNIRRIVHYIKSHLRPSSTHPFISFKLSTFLMRFGLIFCK